MKRGKKDKLPFGKITIAVLAMVALIYLGWRASGLQPSDKFHKPMFAAPEFSFPERSGRVFSSSELKGKVWVADFIFAHCAGSCPLLSQKMRNLQEAWKNQSDFKLVTFTVDPDRDTVQVLKEYADDYHADPDQWFFLTGKKADVYRTIRQGFREIAEPNSDPEPGFDFIHTTRLVLVDGDGQIRGLYDGENDDEIKKLQQDVKYLMGSRSHD